MDDIACQAPLSMERSSQEYWSGLQFCSLSDIPSAGIKLWSPALQAILYHLSHQGSPCVFILLDKMRHTKIFLSLFEQNSVQIGQGQTRSSWESSTDRS